MAVLFKNANPGIHFDAFMVGPTKGVLVASMNELEDRVGLIAPQKAAKMSKAQRSAASKKPQTARAAAYADLRERMQRIFNKERNDRVEDYARYIKRVEIDDPPKPGGTPTPTLAFFLPEENSKFTYQEDQHKLVLPYGTDCLLVDGETQYAARHVLRDAKLFDGDERIAFTFYIADHDLAQAIFHDYNLLVHPVKESLTFKLNQDSPITQAATRVCAALGKDFHGAVNWRGTTLRKDHVTTRAHLVAFTLGFAEGEKAFGNVENAVKRISAGLVAVDVAALATHFQSLMSLDRNAYPPPVICMLAGIAINANHDLAFGTALRLAADAYEAARDEEGRPNEWRKKAAREIIAKAKAMPRRRAVA